MPGVCRKVITVCGAGGGLQPTQRKAMAGAGLQKRHDPTGGLKSPKQLRNTLSQISAMKIVAPPACLCSPRAFQEFLQSFPSKSGIIRQMSPMEDGKLQSKFTCNSRRVGYKEIHRFTCGILRLGLTIGISSIAIFCLGRLINEIQN